MTRKRRFVISNITNVMGKWKLFHVKWTEPKMSTTLNEAGLEKYPNVRERENRSVDEPKAWKFNITGGCICGPSHAARGGDLPLGPALPHSVPHEDTHMY